ncbi:MAG: hypothetical protein U1F83_04410 [Verrucomicrobiota bacterium]
MILAVAGPAMMGAETAALIQTRAMLEQWAQTRQLISKIKRDWLADKESLEQTFSLFEGELKSVDEQMTEMSTNNTQVVREK